MANGNVELEKKHKSGNFMCTSSNAWAGAGVDVTFVEETVVTELTGPKNSGGSFARTYPAGFFIDGPISSLIVSSGAAIVGKADA